jgi:acyl-CoA thioester hydrolase
VAVIEQTVTRVGRTSLDLNITIGRSDEPGVVYATGRSVLVWYDYQNGRSVPWPDNIRAALS